MRCLNKNKQTIYYKTYSGITAITDANGYPTGEYETTYSTIKTIDVNVSASAGVASEEVFGIGTNYARIIITDNITCDMDEHSIVWIGIQTTSPHNYVVVKKAKSLNSITYGLMEVDISEATVNAEQNQI